MTIKLIASDLDGTLLNERCMISQRTKEAIRRLKEKGIIFTFATGRMYRSALHFALELEMDVPLITYEGALVKTSATKQVIYHRPLPGELAKKVVDIGEENRLNINVYLDDELYVHRVTEEIRDYCRVVQVPYNHVENWSSLLDRDPTKVLFMGEAEKLDYLWVQLKEEFGDQVYITKSSPHFLEFTHPRATKGYGIKVLAQEFGIKKEEIMAFGDNLNDLELLKAAGFGVAMGNAREELKQVADYVTGYNYEDGVAAAIEKFVLD
ncbi:MAG: Cof-type HAD-IIB family hydrolase [Bacillota bacterium]|jgi:Cof subfamily protein (haloacid dehalogenase superfamily)|nr:HAD family phosphatase [Clostridia bacterium]